MREQRKVVTVLFADVVGSTELASHTDPELVRSLMSRHFERIVDIARAYGGIVEKFAGDAAMVVFGVPAVHDDDAERAVRAALEIRDRATDLQVRVGVNTGEAVTALTEDRQFMVSGDTVNVAARLQQGADPGDVLVGDVTHRLTRAVIEFEPHAPVVAKGKPEPLPAHRALRARTDVPTQVRGVPGLHSELIGRDRELHILLDTYARVAEDRNAHLFTIVGAPGIGKSRLVTEALNRLAGNGARVLHGRCLPYGRGITYWPLVEMLRQDTGIALVDDGPAALRKLERWLGELMAEEEERPAVYQRLAVMLGYASAESVMPDTPGDRVAREIAWAVRRYFESVARSAPLITVFDDVQWAEPPVLALIEMLAERTTGLALLIVCVARPEFVDTSGGWKSAKPNSTTITLEPLSAAETSTLVARLLEIEALPGGLRQQIVERSAGTPLFVEEFVHMLIDEGNVVREGSSWRAAGSVTQVTVPREISAILAARLDLLSDDERQVLQAASVIGQRFALDQVEPLSGTAEVEARLESLRRKGLVTGGDRDDYEFRHLLIRDAAYASLTKAARATLHDRFRQILETSGDPDLIVEILAYHAERAFAMSRELGLDRETVARRARDATRWLLASADRARTRYDAKTLEATLRALAEAAEAGQAPEGEPQTRIRLLEAQLAIIKGDYPAAARLADEAATLAQRAELWSIEATARLAEAWIVTWALAGPLEEHQRVARRAVEACRRANDVSGEIEARHVESFGLWSLGDARRFAEVNEALLARAREAGDVAHVAQLAARLVAAYQTLGRGGDAGRAAKEAGELARTHGFRNVALRVMMDEAGAATNRGEFQLGEEKWRAMAAAAQDGGARQFEISANRFLGYLYLYSGRAADAAGALDRALELSVATGERWNRSELLALRARAALESGDLETADRMIAAATESLRGDDLTADAEVNTHLGWIRAAQGRDAEAETALRRAVEVVRDTDFLSVKAPAAFHLAVFLDRHGRQAEAREVLEPYVGLAHGRGWHVWDGLLARDLTRQDV